MKRLTFRTLLFVAIDVVLLVISLYQAKYILDRPGIPFVLDKQGSVIVVDRIVQAEASSPLRAGDTVLVFDGHSIESPYDADFLSDYRSIGDSVAVSVKRGGQPTTARIILVPFFRTWYAIVSLLVGVVTWILAIFVLVSRPRDRTAAVLHLSLVSLAYSVMCMWGATPRGDAWVFVGRSMYFIMYMGAATHFLFFTTIFPRPLMPVTWRRVSLLYSPGILVAIAAMLVHHHAVWFSSMESYRIFRVFFHLFHITVLCYCALGIWNFIRSYRATEMPDEKKKLQWLLWGLTIGPAPFLLLEILPELFIPLSPVPEEYTLVFFLAIPTSFAVSFVRYHLLDVQVVINRTTVYGIVIAILVAFYVVLVALAAYLIGSYTLQASTVAAILVALGFEPLRRKVQLSVDRRFFRVRYDFRRAQRKFAEEMNHQHDLNALATFVTREFQKLVPVDTIACCTVQEDGRLRVVAELPERSLDRFPDFLSQTGVWAGAKRPLMLPTKIEMGVPFQPADPKMFERWGLSMVFPMFATGGQLLGVLAVGGKKSGARFSSEDVDLLVNIATYTGLEIERIILQQEVIRKEAEAQRQKELNELKSEFVSYVSHEFRTPLTSIKMFAELVGSRVKGRDTRSREFLHVIEGEADRLDRMVTTILDGATIERGGKKYHFVDSDLGDIVREVLHAMSYQLKKEGFKVQTVGLTHGRRHPVCVDHDSVVESLTNLIANAIKYSAKRKKITLTLVNSPSWVRCSVEDQGRGIPPEALPHIFEKFYRVPSSSFEIEGVGLGLALAKSIMEAHGGRIKVESTLGTGSRFHLLFPRVRRGHPSGAKADSRHRG